jgi:hypothetical protein
MRLLMATVMISGLVSHASQVVVTEVTYTHSATTTSDSHLRVDPLPGTPSNWVSPIDYSHGTAVVRLEVFSKPTNTPTRFQICFEATPNYACTDQAPAYTTTGVYTWTTQFTNFYQYSLVDWSQGTNRVALILKDTNNVKPAPENVGATVSAMYMPTDLRVTVTLVSPGGTYVPPVVDAGVPDSGVVDSGVVVFDSGVVDAGVVDAGVVDAGVVDAGDLDAGELDAGVEATGPVSGGCGCSGAPFGLALFVVMAGLRRRVTPHPDPLP